jgi:hypothetical protein
MAKMLTSGALSRLDVALGVDGIVVWVAFHLEPRSGPKVEIRLKSAAEPNDNVSGPSDAEIDYDFLDIHEAFPFGHEHFGYDTDGWLDACIRDHFQFAHESHLADRFCILCAWP